MNRYFKPEFLPVIITVASSFLALLALCFIIEGFALNVVPYLPAIVLAAVFGIRLNSIGIFVIVVVCSFLIPLKFSLFTEWSLGLSGGNHYENYIILEFIDSCLGLFLGAIPAAFWYTWQNSSRRFR